MLCWDSLWLVCGAGTVLSLLLQGRVWTAQQAGCHRSGLGAWFELPGSSRQARLSCKYPLRGQSCGDSACPQGRLRWGAPLSLAHGSFTSTVAIGRSVLQLLQLHLGVQECSSCSKKR